MADIEKSIYMSFIPEYLRDNKDFLVFLQLLATEFDISFENIEKFTDLVNPDKVPIKFIEALGSYTDFRFVENADDDFNRELMMRMQTIYEQRGTDHSIIMAATHGSNLGYVGGDIFIPGYDISKDTATLIVARDSIFTHSRSRHSGTDVFADGETFRPGVLIIQLPYIDEDILKKVTEVMPAGVRYKFFLNSSFVGNASDDSLGKFGELSYYKSFRVIPLTNEEKKQENSASNMELDISLPMNPENFNIAKFSTNVTGRRLRSGRMVTTEEVSLESEVGASMLAYRILCKGFISPEDLAPDDIEDVPVVKEDSKLFIRSSESGRYSSVNKASGVVTEINDIPDGTAKYIISPSGEKLDILCKNGSAHLHRDISDSQEVMMDLGSEIRLTAIRSHSSCVRSGRGKMSGILTHVIDSQVQIMEITPYDSLYFAYEVDSLKPSDFRNPFYQSSIEIGV